MNVDEAWRDELALSINLFGSFAHDAFIDFNDDPARNGNIGDV
jgi:hypothetical protein